MSDDVVLQSVLDHPLRLTECFSKAEKCPEKGQADEWGAVTDFDQSLYERNMEKPRQISFADAALWPASLVAEISR